MIDTRTRVLAIVGSLVVLGLIVDLVRRRRLKEEYSVVWVLTALVLLVLAAWLELLKNITDLIGGVALSSTLFFMGLMFVFLMLLHFSVRVSGLERRLTALVQEIGLMAARPAHLPVERAEAPADDASANASRVSVIVPCYDDGALAEEAVASVQEQEAVEIVVVDDGSTDPATLSCLEAMRARGVHVVRQENRGPGEARNAGLKHTRAPLVYPLDADDRLEPGALAAMADALEAAPDAGFAWGDYILFGDQKGRYRSPAGWLPWTLTYVNPYPVGSMFRRGILQDADGWHGRAYEDWDLWLCFVDKDIEGVRVDRVVYRRRLHGDSRVQAQARLRHQELYADLRRRHAEVFERRADLRRRERPAVWKRAVYPVLFGARKVVPRSVEAFLQRTMMRLGTGLPG